MRDRASAGTILAPRFVLAGVIEGPLRWAGPSEVLVATEAEARAWVARYDSLAKRADASYLRLLRRLYDAGVTLVAGTDGRIAAGKVADLAIVDGKRHERVADLRKVRQAMRAGRLYERQRILDAMRPPRQADASP